MYHLTPDEQWMLVLAVLAYLLFLIEKLAWKRELRRRKRGARPRWEEK